MEGSGAGAVQSLKKASAPIGEAVTTDAADGTAAGRGGRPTGWRVPGRQAARRAAQQDRRRGDVG